MPNDKVTTLFVISCKMHELPEAIKRAWRAANLPE